MTFAARSMILTAVIGVLSGVTRGDGKFFVREKVPADVPYQRALLLHHEGSETLVLQSKYDLKQSATVNSLGWVVPVPAVPSIASTDPGIARDCFFRAALRTQPRVLRISSMFAWVSLAMFLGGFASMLVCLAQYPFARKSTDLKKAWGQRARTGTLVTVLALLMLLMTMPTSLTRGGGGLEIVKAQQVGIYDVKVIRSEHGEVIAEWLKENNFSFTDEDSRILQDYADRGWCFVAAKIQPKSGTKENEIVAEGLAAPLILEFACAKPIYPLALTATTGHETEVLIYTLSDDKLACGGTVTLRHARRCNASEVLRSFLVLAQAEEWPVLRHVPETPMMLCQFKDRLSPAQMREDLAFDSASDNQPYRERRIVW